MSGAYAEAERSGGEEEVEVGDVEDDAVEGDGGRDCEDEVLVDEDAGLEQRLVLAQRVEGVEHLDHDQDGQRHGAGSGFACGEVEARVFVQAEVVEVVHLEVGPVGALGPVPESVEGDQRVLVCGPAVVEVPVEEDADGAHADVDAGGEVSDHEEAVDDAVVLVSGRADHDVRVSGVEAERHGRKAVGHQVDPEQLDGVEAVGEAED